MQKWAVFNEAGIVTALYSDDVHTSIPGAAAKITLDQWHELAAKQSGVRNSAASGEPVTLEAVPVPLANIQTTRIAQLQGDLVAELEGGFDSSALGAAHTYDSEPINQDNLIGAVAAGVDLAWTCDDQSGGAGAKAPRMHTAAQLKTVLQDGAAVRFAAIGNFRAKRDAVLAATDAAGVAAVTW